VLAQQAGRHAFSLGVLVNIHGEAGNLAAAEKTASATTTDVTVLLTIKIPNSTIGAAR
jgi:NAD(P)H-hydrate repair Nnr-like enzyme with NAD(P)H-hydrate dehydratase domain